MSGIYDSIYATMLAEGRSYEDISQSVERLHTRARYALSRSHAEVQLSIDHLSVTSRPESSKGSLGAFFI